MKPTDPVAAVLLQAVLDEPTVDLHRLAFADWLDEHGKELHAEFIRVQIELAGFPDPCGDPIHCASGPTPPQASFGIVLDWCGRQECLRRNKLRTREQELRPESYRFGCVHEITWRRGFVAVFRCSCTGWLEQGPELIRCQPIERVELSDKEPIHCARDAIEPEHWRWFRGDEQDLDEGLGADELPLALWDAYEAVLARSHYTKQLQLERLNHPCREHALAALSLACKRWAKQQAVEATR